jgi:hypothetical protein
MFKKIFPPAVLILLAITSLSSATAAEQATGCKLKGGTIVPLDAATCAMEGGTLIAAPVAAPAVPAPAAANTPTAQYSSDPKLAAAQRAVVDLLNKPVVDKHSQKISPEGVERTAKFDGCRLIVDESMRVDHGNLVSARKNFKIGSTVDFRSVSREALGVLGKISSLGGGLKAHAVYVEESKRKDGNNIAISVLEQSEDGFTKLTLPRAAAYWDAPRDDLWMADEYGYPKDNGMGDAVTNRIRILFIVSTSDDAAALKKALDDVHALCKP